MLSEEVLKKVDISEVLEIEILKLSDVYTWKGQYNSWYH